MLYDQSKRLLDRTESMPPTLQNVTPSRLTDLEFFDFVGLERGRTLGYGSDLAFDSERMPECFLDGLEEDSSGIRIEPQKAKRKIISILASKSKTCGA